MSRPEEEPLLVNGQPRPSVDIPSSTPAQAQESASLAINVNIASTTRAVTATAPPYGHTGPMPVSNDPPITPSSGSTDWGNHLAGASHEYEPPYRWNSEGVIVLRETDLNQDGEALYRFLLSQAEDPPNFIIHVQGIRGINNGPPPLGQPQTTEFDFKIDLTQHLLQAVKWTASDDEPTYRGKIVQEREVQNGMWLEATLTTDEENKAADDWKEVRKRNGYPPWIPMSSAASTGGQDHPVQAELHSQPLPALGGSVYRSSKTLHDWTGEYCSSGKLLKEFIFEKVVYGWNLGAIEKSIEGLIRSTYFEGQLSIEFSVTRNEVKVKPDNELSRILEIQWVKVLLCILLIYPIIKIWERYWPLGGGKWKVAGAAYPLKQWVHMEDSIRGETVAQYLMRKGEIQVAPSPPPYVVDRKTALASGPATQPTQAQAQARTQGSYSPHSPYGSPPTYSAASFEPTSMIPLVGNNVLSRFKQTPRGISRLVGMREGEWFKQWETTILRAVMSKLNSPTPLSSPSEVIAESSGATLDGYD